jgi:hypothetical protein
MKVKIIEYKTLWAWGASQPRIAPEWISYGNDDNDIEDSLDSYLSEENAYSDKYRGFEWEWVEVDIPSLSENCNDNKLQKFKDTAEEMCDAHLPKYWRQFSWGTRYKEQKLLELIVMECLEKISGLIVPETFEQSISPYEKWNRALATVALEIEQHFYGND